jgi:hypothetical protein
VYAVRERESKKARESESMTAYLQGARERESERARERESETVSDTKQHSHPTFSPFMLYK